MSGCPSMGLIIALECILDDMYLFFSNQALLERCLIRKHAFVTCPCADFAFGPKSAPKFPCCDSPQVGVGS